MPSYILSYLKIVKGERKGNTKTQFSVMTRQSWLLLLANGRHRRLYLPLDLWKLVLVDNLVGCVVGADYVNSVRKIIAYVGNVLDGFYKDSC